MGRERGEWGEGGRFVLESQGDRINCFMSKQEGKWYRIEGRGRRGALLLSCSRARGTGSTTSCQSRRGRVETEAEG